MHIRKIFNPFEKSDRGLNVAALGPIYKECSVFLNECHGNPLFKTLPTDTGPFKKIKVRYRNIPPTSPYSFLAERFGETFPKKTVNCTSNYPKDIQESGREDQSAYFIFPINGYQFVYSKHVEDLTLQYKQLQEQFVNLEYDSDVPIEQLYSNIIQNIYEDCPSLSHALRSGGEILLHNISHFYAVRVDDHVYSDIVSFGTGKSSK